MSIFLLGLAAAVPAGVSNGDCLTGSPELYNMSFHVAGLFIVFAVSSFGLFVPLLLGLKSSSSLANVFQLVKMFGFGVIAGTAWIHLLPDAFSQFGNPCLQGGWSAYGQNYVGLFGLIGAYLVQVIEASAMSHVHAHKGISNNEAAELPMKLESPKHHEHHDHDHVETVVNIPESSTAVVCQGDKLEAHQDVEHRISTVILEAGILVHSLVIGLTLGVSGDSNFGSLLAAVCFHQLFEGLALGVLLSKTSFSWLSKVGLSIMYPLTTPIGIGLGIGVKNFYNENSQEMIVTQGILDSLSAGILIYTAYCELMAGEMNHNPTFLSYSRSFKIGCYLMMYLGAASMAVVGIWA